jgi:ribosomal protein S18 acetylase RimI-like enzyme
VSVPLIVSEVADADVPAVIALWERAGLTRPWNDPARDIAFARASPNAAVLVGRERADGPVIAACMVGHDGHRGWLYYLGVDPAHQRRGVGRMLLRALLDRADGQERSP